MLKILLQQVIKTTLDPSRTTISSKEFKIIFMGKNLTDRENTYYKTVYSIQKRSVGILEKIGQKKIIHK